MLICSFCFLPHLLQEIGVVFLSFFRVGVLRAKRLFTNGQGTLVERLGLLVLVLLIVEACQVVECARGIGMLRAKRLFPNCQSALVERLRLPVLAPASVEVCP